MKESDAVAPYGGLFPIMFTMFGRIALFAIALLLTPSAMAGEPALDRIHALLLQVREHHQKSRGDQSLPMRGAEPLLDEVKHELRDWIEPQLAQLADRQMPDNTIQPVDPAELTQDLNRRLTAANLDCTGGDSKSDRCSTDDFSWDATGYALGVKIENQLGNLVVTTSVGLVCGGDDSAYVYQWRDNHWQRVLDDEQQIVPGKPYAPFHVAAVYTSRANEKTKKMNVLVLGQGMWCQSNWNGNSYRIWRTSADGSAAKLLFRDDPYSVSTEPAIIGSINSTEALIEYTTSDLETEWYQTVRHFRLDGPTAVRDDPVALGQRAFVQEWIQAPWSDAHRWSEAAVLQEWHRKLHVAQPFGEFSQTMQCTVADTWQVSVNFRKEDHEINTEQTYVGLVYFTIRWLPPYRFRLVSIGMKPSLGCTKPDEAADSSSRTLFPTQDRVGWH